MKLDEQLASHRGDARHSLLEVDAEGNLQPTGTDVAAPTEEELAVPYVAPGESATLPLAVTYQADWHARADGMARHARAQALALAASGVPVVLESIANGGGFLDSDIDPDVLGEMQRLRSLTTERAVLAIRHAVLHTADFTRSLLLPKAARLVDAETADTLCKHTIIYTSWERDHVPSAIADVLRRAGQVWVPCRANADAFFAAGIRAQVVPYPYVPGTWTSSLAFPYATGSTRVPDGKRFYTIGKWEPRKDQLRLLRAFLLAFTPRDKASLVIKTSAFNRWVARDGSWEYPDLDAAFAEMAQDSRIRGNGWNNSTLPKRVKIINEKISEEKILELHASNNIYVSASHGEAWDLPAFDAVSAGNRLVHVGYGGSRDYALPDDVSVPFWMAPAHPAYEWEPEAGWAEYHDDALVDALRRAEPRPERIHPLEFGWRFSASAVGEEMRKLLYICGANAACGSGSNRSEWQELWLDMKAQGYR